jgi:uncharacterized protein YodC (DUF2158 family)
MAEPWQVGDVVQLKSGGPAMTVTEVDGHLCTCAWFVGNAFSETKLPAEALAVPTTPGAIASGEKPSSGY